MPFVANFLLQKRFDIQLSDQSKSWLLANKALKQSQNINYNQGIAASQICIGSILYTRGELDSAKTAFIWARSIYTNEKNFKGAAGAHLLLSYLFLDLGLKDSAFASISWDLQMPAIKPEL